MTQKKQFTRSVIAQAVMLLMATASTTGFAQPPLAGAMPGSIPGVSTTPPAVPNGTDPSGGSGGTCVAPACINLSASTIGAINNAYLFSSLNNAALKNTTPYTYFSAKGFTGGTLMAAGVTQISVPASAPALAVVWSGLAQNCSSKKQNATVTQNLNVNSTLTITSESSTSSSNTQSLGGQTSVSLTLTLGDPAVATASGTASQTFDYGSEITTTSSASQSNSATGGTSLDDDQTLTVSLDAYSQQVVQITDTMSTVPTVSWTQPVALSGNLNVQFQQQFKNTQPVQWVNNVNGNSDAYVAYPTTAWRSTANDVFASPNGVTAVIPASNGDVYSNFLAGINTLVSNNSNSWFGPTWNSPNYNQGSILIMGSGSAGTTMYIANSANNTVIYGPVAGQYLAQQNDGGMVVYGAGLYQDNWNNAGQGGSNTSSAPLTAPIALSASQLLGAIPVFTASGTYASTTYSGSGNLIFGPITTMTSAQLAACPTGPTSPTSPTSNNTTPGQELGAPSPMYASNTSKSQSTYPGMMYASYTPDSEQPQFIKAQHNVRRDANGSTVAPRDDRKSEDKQVPKREQVPKGEQVPKVEQMPKDDPRKRNESAEESKSRPDLKQDSKVFATRSLPHTLSRTEFYANKDTEVKLTLTNGDALTTALRFLPGPQEVISNPTSTRPFRMKVTTKKVFKTK